MANTISAHDRVLLQNFGNSLNKVLKKVGLSKKEFAKKIDVHPNMVSRWIKGKANPTLTSFYDILNFFTKRNKFSKPLLDLFPTSIKKGLNFEIEHYYYQQLENKLWETINDYENKLKTIKEERKKDEKIIQEAQQTLTMKKKLEDLQHAFAKIKIEDKQNIIYKLIDRKYLDDLYLY